MNASRLQDRSHLHAGVLGVRPLSCSSDLAALVDLVNASAAHEPTENLTTIKELQADLARPNIDLEENGVVLEANGRVIGFAALLVGPGADAVQADLWMRVHPEAVDSSRVLLDWALERATQIAGSENSPVDLLALVGESQSRLSRLLRRQGFAVVRIFAQLHRHLSEPLPDADLPQGLLLRALTGIEELDAWFELFQASFADHWRPPRMTLAEARHFVQQDPSYRPASDLVAIAPDGTFAALCQCVVRSEENAATGRADGWIAWLGVSPKYRRLGLGRAMLLCGMKRLAVEGLTCVRLGVDAANPTGAFRLYESLGFSTAHRRQAYLRRCLQATSGASRVATVPIT